MNIFQNRNMGSGGNRRSSPPKKNEEVTAVRKLMSVRTEGEYEKRLAEYEEILRKYQECLDSYALKLREVVNIEKLSKETIEPEELKRYGMELQDKIDELKEEEFGKFSMQLLATQAQLGDVHSQMDFIKNQNNSVLRQIETLGRETAKRMEEEKDDAVPALLKDMLAKQDDVIRRTAMTDQNVVQALSQNIEEKNDSITEQLKEIKNVVGKGKTAGRVITAVSLVLNLLMAGGILLLVIDMLGYRIF